jgi:ribosomal protein S18 acetylase RimI-like enzyme
MDLAAFLAQHGPALEQDEVRHNLILGVLGAAAAAPGPAPVATWTLGGPGECAIATPGRPLILGALGREQCRLLAELTHAEGYAGVVGVDRTTDWFVERAAELGAAFAEPTRQRLHVLRGAPKYPGASGRARGVEAIDVPRVADYLEAFTREALPHDPVPPRPALEKRAATDPFVVWDVAGEVVSVAGIVRRTRNTAAIAWVYTPPELRGRGYAGSATAAVVERIFAEGRSAACLYTDLANPASNRCYEKIGFEPACDAAHVRRIPSG